MTFDFTPLDAALNDAATASLALEAQANAATAETAELNRQLAAAIDQIAWFNTRPRPRVHLVAAGESLSVIAATYSTPLVPITAANLRDWNDLVSDVIHPDDILYLTDGYDAPDLPPEEPAKVYPEFSIDISNLGSDAGLTSKQKLDAHKALVQPNLLPEQRYLRNVRVFIGNRALSWTDERLQALTELDSFIISVSTKRTRAEVDSFLAATPERFRRFVDQVKLCYKHECEAEWQAAGKSKAWMDDYLAGNKMLSDALAASPWPTQTKDGVVKIMLWYSQHIDAALKDTLEQFYGGQQFGYFGMDCYHYQAWGSKGRYATPEELFGKIVGFCRSKGIKTIIAEWGGERAAGDSTGTGRAKAITDGGAYLVANSDVVAGANWWCAVGSKDAVTGQPRQHHLDQPLGNINSPEAIAFRTLANA